MKYFDPVNNVVRDASDKDLDRGKFMNWGLGKDIIFTLRLKNTVSGKQNTLEIFNALNCIAYSPANKSQYLSVAIGSDIKPVPLDTVEILKFIAGVAVAAEANEPNNVQMNNWVTFNPTNGDLVYCGFPVATTILAPEFMNADNDQAYAWVKCNQSPYSSMIKDMLDLVIHVKKIKAQFSSVNQHKNPFRVVRKRTFGGEDSVTIEPSEFLSPHNPQSLVVDIERDFFIDKHTGIYIDLEPQEDMLLTFFVDAYRNNGVIFS